jgi:dimethylargininase
VFKHAICRRPGADPGRGLTTAGLGAPDAALTFRQHEAYVEVLRALGLAVTVMEGEPGFPDAHFVEDTAVVTPEAAVICRPGHPARRGEERTVAPVLAAHLPLEHIREPGTVDGGDVLQVRRHVFIGISERTNCAGADQLGAILSRHGRTWTAVPLSAGLHLKSSINEVGDALLVTPDFADRVELADFPKIVVPRGEEYAANTLRIGDHLLMPAGYPGTRRELERLGMGITELDLSEMRKMDGGLTCLSLRW